ncbi:hypothetical protein [Synechococcus sp. PCC 7502]|uniref:hypothetical protein n=1 Tax=Synechococcus sp. PCC 7502 TaxID=1173263 RepID=UPI0002F84B51|nr:hypothetical protein [Synechococcus sp. PCC 7502]
MSANFGAYLDDREGNDSTEELLSIPNFKEDFQKALQDFEKGNVVSFKSIRRHV